MLKKFIIPLIILGFLSVCQSQTVPSEEVQNNIKARIDNGINTGIVVGILDATGIHYYSYGVKSLKTKEAVDKHSVFEIGSISKTFTGLLLADMVLKKKVYLDDDLQKYLPEGVTAPTRNGATIQLVHMANHTSSLPRMPSNFNPANAANPFADYSEKLLYEFLNTYDLSRDIGSQYEYSNYAMGLLGHILATKNAMTYEDLLSSVITKALHLDHTGITLSPTMKKNLALGHSGGEEVENWDLTTLAGAGAIRSTAVDMLKYLAANMGKEKSALYPAMQLAHKNSRIEGAEPIVGLGWHTMVFDDLKIVWHNGGTGGYRTFAGFVKGGDKAVVVLSNSNAAVDDIGIHILRPASPLNKIKPSIAIKLQNSIDQNGIETGLKTYWNLKKNQAEEFDFSETQLNQLGYRYLRSEEVEKAIAVFKLNTEAYPNSSNVYDSYGEALMKNGDKEQAIVNYSKSLELNPGSQNAIEKLKELGVDPDGLVKEISINEKVLETYTGKYQLAPNFILSISKDGNQLKAQATGQAEVSVFPKTENVFYYKVVEAQLTFNQNEEGEIESVTLNQGGMELIGKKIE
ncbi:MAG: serine hydrolase [Flavobacteriaceae bacterium]